MQESEFPEGGTKGGRGVLIAFVVGLVVGLVAAFVAQPLLGRRLPEAVRGKYEVLEGPVTAKQTEDERLLLTISTRAGAILATFKKRVDEINLLVEEGDTVALDVPGYQPFMQNPEIIRVAKPDPEAVAQEPQEPEAQPEAESPAEPTVSEPAMPDTVPDTMPASPADSIEMVG